MFVLLVFSAALSEKTREPFLTFDNAPVACTYDGTRVIGPFTSQKEASLAGKNLKVGRPGESDIQSWHIAQVEYGVV